MPTQMIRIDKAAHAELRRLAKTEGKPMQEVLSAAIERYRREQIIAQTNAAFVALRRDRKAWKEELAERKLWESTLADGLTHD